EPTDVERTEAEQLKIVLRRSRQETYISQQRSSGTEEGTGSRSGVPDVPSDDSEEELSWNSFDDEDDKAEKVDDDDDDEEEITKIGEQDVTESDEGDDEATESDRESKDEETREQEEESFDLIPRTPEESMESIFTTGSTTVTPIPSPQSTMTTSIISTFTTASQLPTPPPQIPSLDLQSLPTFASVFRFEDRVKFLEENLSNIPADLSEMELKKILIEKMEGNNESAFAEEPVQTTCQMEEPSHLVFETVNQESALDVYSKRRIIAVTELKIVEWHNYKHLDWISVRRDDDKIDELHKFSDGTLNDVRNALDDRLNGIRMLYLPTTICRKGDKDRAAAMIQAIDKMLKTRRIMRSLE
nr:hypothetical protein [Tanacetum cinerariifolium]GFA42430.1 hypothetical protein [Tanacetum cinerariifolium]